MLERFVKWLLGYLIIGINGSSTERFLNLCHAREIMLWDVMKTEKEYQCKISIQDFKGIRPIARKTKTRPYIMKRKGFPFHIKRIKPRKGLWMGGLLFFAMIYMLSSFVWEIQVLGQHSYTEEALLDYLEKIDVYAGMPRKKISCPDIEASIRETYTDIGWVSAELRGSKLFVRIQETNMPTLYETDTTPRHLVAARSGVVDSIITRTGTPLVKKGDVVEKGDILISGVVTIYGDSGEVLKKEAVRADGDVMIQSDTSYYNEVSKKYFKKTYMNERVNYEIQALTYCMRPMKLWNELLELIRIKKEDETTQEQGMDLLIEQKEFYFNKSLKLPITIVRKVERKYVLEQEEYTKKEMETILEKKFNHYLEKLTEKGVIIGENSVRIVTSEFSGTICGSFGICEKSDKFQKVMDDEWRTVEADEYSGSNN